VTRHTNRIMIGFIVAVVVICLGLLVYRHFHHKQTINPVTLAQEQQLQSLLTQAQNDGSYTTSASMASQLIDGAKSGEYKFSSSTLAQYYLEYGSALANLKEYQQAIPAFQMAVKTNGQDQYAALQGEASAEYALGERQQIIPILKQLSVLAAHGADQLGPTAAQYQADIQSIENNQPITLQ
jgi:tetratricopeptide (TPR) repeat protein